MQWVYQNVELCKKNTNTVSSVEERENLLYIYYCEASQYTSIVAKKSRGYYRCGDEVEASQREQANGGMANNRKKKNKQ